MSNEAELQLLEKANETKLAFLKQVTAAMEACVTDISNRAEEMGVDASEVQPEVEDVHSSLLASILLGIAETNYLLRAIFSQGHQCDEACDLPPGGPTGDLKARVDEFIEQLFGKKPDDEPAEPVAS